MTNEEMLRNIEYLREKADVSYEDAEKLLERFDGNVMRALVELEQQGRVYAQPHSGESTSKERQENQQRCNEAKEKATSFVNKALQTRLVVEKKDEKGEKQTVANVNLPFAAVVAVAAPWLTVATAGLAVITGHNVKIEKDEPKKTEES